MTDEDTEDQNIENDEISFEDAFAEALKEDESDEGTEDRSIENDAEEETRTDEGTEAEFAIDGWSDEDLALLEGQSPEFKDFLAEKFKNQEPAKADYSDIFSTEQLQELEQGGSSPQEEIKASLDLVNAMQERPGEFVKAIVNASKLDPAELFGIAKDGTNSPEQLTPEQEQIQALEKKLEEQAERDAEVRAYIQKQEQAANQQRIQEFVNAKDDEGNLLHPHFKEPGVLDEIIKLSQAGYSMEESYEIAVSRNEKLSAANKAVAEARERARKARQTEAAKAKTNQNITGKPIAPAGQSDSLEDAFNSAWSETVQ